MLAATLTVDTDGGGGAAACWAIAVEEIRSARTRRHEQTVVDRSKNAADF
jgi:hypothetical protein